tara:strand:+ start:7352 stop:8236 length:885 start_codon:yes stop_codon:yes gene_type:complete
MTVKKLIIDQDNSGRRLDNFLLSNYKNIPKSKIYNIIRKGEVRVNSKRIKPSYKLKIDDLIRIPPYLEESQDIDKNINQNLIEKHCSKIIYEDENYIIVNKSNDIAVHSGTKNGIGLIDLFRKKLGSNIELCHRIDKQTTGCLVLAKNKTSVRHFSNLLNSNEINKIYSALVKGKFEGKKLISNKIYKNNPLKLKQSKSIFKLVKQLKGASLINIKIQSGRTHQIRIHASQLNHPILFDKKYGDVFFNNSIDVNFKKTLALHSKSISFKDQNSNLIRVTAKYPDELKNLIKALT